MLIFTKIQFMKKYILYFSLFLMVATAFMVEGCSRGNVRSRKIWFSDHNVTVVRKPYRGARHQLSKKPITNTNFNRGVRVPGR
jgi:hypothetical protein